MTIGILSDDVLLDIFDFCRDEADYSHLVWEWHLLVHVCRRWRQIIFESPHRLDLRILCTRTTPVKNLGIWPAFPIVVDFRYPRCSLPRETDEDNIIAALQQPDRVCHIKLNNMGSRFAKLAAVMQEPFPVLTHLNVLNFGSNGGAPVLPAEFLGGSAPCLERICLLGIPFPTLPKLLLSASNLVDLNISHIPPTGYISPEAMVSGLAALACLQNLIIAFESAIPRPTQIHPPPITRTVLPVLYYFEFRGACEYLENLVAQINSPQLDAIHLNYLNQSDDVPLAQLSEFVRRSVGPKLNLLGHARVSISSDLISFAMHHYTDPLPWDERYCPILLEGHWQVSNMIQALGQFSATAILSDVVHLKLDAELDDRHMDDAEWTDLLHPFSAVQTLHVSQELAKYVALALEGTTGEMVTEVLPSLESIYLEGQPPSSIEKFVAARRLSGRQITVVETELEFIKTQGLH